MDDELSRTKMEQQVERLDETSLVARNGWAVEVGPADGASPLQRGLER